MFRIKDLATRATMRARGLVGAVVPPALRRRVETTLEALAPDWTAARRFDEEVRFWRGVVQSRGGPYKQDYDSRLDPATPLQPHLVAVLPDRLKISLLDVGAGPLTVVGKRCPGRDLSITAVDPLAEEYDRILCAAGVEPLVRTRKGFAETLDELFAPDTFDVVHTRNALDHSQDPAEGLRQMYRVVKPGCTVSLGHFINEGKRQGYHGLHAWNVTVERGMPALWNPGKRFTVESLFPSARIESTVDLGEDAASGWIEIRITKPPTAGS